MYPTPGDTLRVMSLNIWNYNEPWARRRDLIVRAVEQVDPHVIGFQEIRHDGKRNEEGRNQAEQLAERLPAYDQVHQPAQRNPDVDQWEGLAIFSRLPILSSSHIELSRNPQDPHDNHQRIVLHAEIQTYLGSLHFFSTHLSLSAQGRERTVREIATFVNQHTSGLPCILVGDFNATPDEEPIDFLTTEAGLADAWVTANGRDPGITFDGANPYTGENEKGRRIDYVFLSGAGASRLSACRRVADRAADDGNLPSDHYGLSADLNLAGPAPRVV